MTLLGWGFLSPPVPGSVPELYGHGPGGTLRTPGLGSWRTSQGSRGDGECDSMGVGQKGWRGDQRVPGRLEVLLFSLKSIQSPFVAAPAAEAVPAHQPGGGGGPLCLAGEPGSHFPPPGRYHEVPRLPQAVSWPCTLLGRIQLTVYQVGLGGAVQSLRVCCLTPCGLLQLLRVGGSP